MVRGEPTNFNINRALLEKIKKSYRLNNNNPIQVSREFNFQPHILKKFLKENKVIKEDKKCKLKLKKLKRR
jgi:hypothetical protein